MALATRSDPYLPHPWSAALAATLALATCVLAGTLVSPAAAQVSPLPDCDGNVRAAGVLLAPERVAVGRTGTFTVDGPRGNPNRYYLPADVRVSAGSAFGDPFSFSYSGGSELADEEGWPIRFAQGDGPAQVLATYPESGERSVSNPDCQRTVSAVVEPHAGELPRLHVQRADFGETLDVSLVGLARSCIDARVGPIAITVRGRGVRRRYLLSDYCGRWRRPPRLSGFKTRTFASQDEPPGLTLSPSGRRNGRKVFGISASADGRAIGRATVRVRWRFVHAEHVDEAEDDFVNYCINRSRPIYSRDGRLYCIVPAYTDHDVRVLRR